MKYLFISLTILLAVGCQKQNNVNDVMDDVTTTHVDRGLIAEIQFAIDHQSHVRASGPANPNNAFDYFGAYERDLILAINAKQMGSVAATSRQEHLQLVSAYMSQNAAPELNTSGEVGSLELSVLQEAKNLFTSQSSTDLKVQSFITMENVIRGSAGLNGDAKARLLALCSSLRYVSYTLGNDGIYVNGNLELIEGWWDCWDQQFSLSVGTNLVNDLFSWNEAPASTALSWWALPWTLGTAIVDGAWQASHNC